MHSCYAVYMEVIAVAEFCLACWNELNKTQLKRWNVELSWDLDFCEGCGQWKHVVVSERPTLLSFFIIDRGEPSCKKKKKDPPK